MVCRANLHTSTALANELNPNRAQRLFMAAKMADCRMAASDLVDYNFGFHILTHRIGNTRSASGCGLYHHPLSKKRHTKTGS